MHSGGISLDRRSALATGLAAGLIPALPAAAQGSSAPPPDARWKLWYRTPARRWVEALPVGNGRLGAMVYGDPARERLQLNEDTLWAGGPYDPVNPEARAAIPQVRALIAQGRYAEAQAMANQRLMARPLRQMQYQTAGELILEQKAEGPVTDYRRWLDLDEAAVTAEWTAGGRAFRRTVFASAPDGVIVLRLQALDGGAIDVTLGHRSPGARRTGNALRLSGRNKAAQGIDGALRWTAETRVLEPGADISGDDGTMRVAGQGALTLITAIRTSYRNWQDVSADPDALVARDLDAAARHDADALRARHRADHQRLFRGFDLDLGPDPFPAMPTDERIRYAHDAGADDRFLPALYTQYGRYLLIACSRPGGQPANLQGLWNDSDSPPWGSKYTININTEMNYWPAEPTGLGECVEPLIAMVEDLAASGRRTAQQMYGARGWVVHHNTDLWRASAPIDGAFWGLWPTGGAWLVKHLWDRWDYSRDPAMLARIYPLMRDCGLFFLDTLVPAADGSGLVTSPSISPENAHHDGVSICEGPAMDRQILRELFGNISAAAALLNQDAALVRQFDAARARIPADRVGKAGQLQEWLADWDMDVPEIQHRHVSHLYALYPGHEIGPESPAMLAAARRSLSIRGDDATGWGIGWRINLWARAGDGNRANLVLRKLLGPERSYPNLFDAHPPFQIDGNLGGAAGVVEMLVRDRPQGTTLLPALPRGWADGRISGVRLRGGLTLDLGWQGGQVAAIRITARTRVTRSLAWNDQRRDIAFAPGKPWQWRIGADG
ncbi:glycosyl hydrolase family 95 catalytic domain-containing protein [Sphingomonas sp. FW199]|uniref:glycoside hydrolase family 95 protein n=1 Tax=Sphingomonas sp. FW199 TaxID=3400217 RepID=UPI003CEE3AA4